MLKRNILLAVLVGLNLRPSMAVIGPLAHRIQQDIGASFSQIALLTSLPVLAMGLGCFITLRLTRYWNMSKMVATSLLLIALADVLRLQVSTHTGLLLTALTAGIGIACIQVLLPILIKQQHRHQAALVMGWYVAAIMAGAAVSAASASWLTAQLGHWQGSLAFWGLIAFVAWCVWQQPWAGLSQKEQAQSRTADHENSIQDHNAQAISTPTKPLTQQTRPWLLALFFGLGTSGYTCVLAWLPPYFVSLGFSEAEAGFTLGYLTAIEVIAGLALPALASYRLDRRRVMLPTLMIGALGFVLLAHAPLSLTWISLTLLGIGIGGIFPLSLIVCMDHHADPKTAGAITGFAQGIGYMMAATAPWLAGIIRDQLDQWSYSWIALAVLYGVMILMAWRFNPQHYARRITPPPQATMSS